jgi:Lon protease-like protein
MFPLSTVLFPHMYLPLRVFERRYREMVQVCVAGSVTFGVVLIERGSEVGGGDQRSMFGTVAEILQVHESPDGQLSLAAVGTKRIRILRWLHDDPYPQALVEAIAEPAWTEAASAAFVVADREVRRSLALLAELGRPAAPFALELEEDPPTAAWQLAAIAPLGPLDRQRLLVIEDPADRMRTLGELVAEECVALAQQLAGG